MSSSRKANKHLRGSLIVFVALTGEPAKNLNSTLKYGVTRQLMSIKTIGGAPDRCSAKDVTPPSPGICEVAIVDAFWRTWISSQAGSERRSLPQR